MTNEYLCSFLKGNHAGQRRTIGGRMLAAKMQISENELRRRINRLRQQGVPIASSQAGYFYAINAGEVYETIRSLRRMAAGLEAAVKGLESALRQFGTDENIRQVTGNDETTDARQTTGNSEIGGAHR